MFKKSFLLFLHWNVAEVLIKCYSHSPSSQMHRASHNTALHTDTAPTSLDTQQQGQWGFLAIGWATCNRCHNYRTQHHHSHQQSIEWEVLLLKRHHEEPVDSVHAICCQTVVWPHSRCLVVAVSWTAAFSLCFCFGWIVGSDVSANCFFKVTGSRWVMLLLLPVIQM